MNYDSKGATLRLTCRANDLSVQRRRASCGQVEPVFRHRIHFSRAPQDEQMSGLKSSPPCSEKESVQGMLPQRGQRYLALTMKMMRTREKAVSTKRITSVANCSGGESLKFVIPIKKKAANPAAGTKNHRFAPFHASFRRR